MEPQTHIMYHYNTFGGFKRMIVISNVGFRLICVGLSMLTLLVVTFLITCLKPTSWGEPNINLQGTFFYH